MDIILPLLVIASLVCLFFGLFFIISFPLVENEPFILSNFNNPIGYTLIAISVIPVTVALSLVYNFLVPVFIIFSVIGYLLSIKYLPKFVLSQSTKVQKAIGRSNMFPYYGTVLLTAFWPLILIYFVFCYIFDILDIKIETPNKSVQRVLNSDKG